MGDFALIEEPAIVATQEIYLLALISGHRPINHWDSSELVTRKHLNWSGSTKSSKKEEEHGKY